MRGNMKFLLLVLWSFTPWTGMTGVDENCERTCEGPMSCVQHIQVSIGVNGYEVIKPPMILADKYPDYSPFVVSIQGLPSDTVFCDQLGNSLMVTVTDTRNGNSCWSNIFIEDKLDPIIVCRNDTLPCYIPIDSVDYRSYVTATDNCDDNLDVWSAQKINTFFCDPNFTASVEMTWTAEDDSGNSARCISIIYFEKVAISSAVFPDDTTIFCPFPDTADVGVPTIGGRPVSMLCELVAFFRDDTLERCSGTFLVEREWTVMDWCTGISELDTQMIEFRDTLPPVPNCSLQDTIGTDYNACEATYIIPSITATDLCSEDDSITFSVRADSFPLAQIGDTIILDTGQHRFVYYAQDDCGNIDSCEFILTVVDDDPPVLICEPEITIYLDSLGEGEICLEDFDHKNHYFDNCGIDSLFIAKMEDLCDTSQSGVFKFCLEFCCNEACEPDLMIVIKAQDFAGNMNFCMIRLNVLDTIAPVITSSPPDTTISCTVDYRDTSMTGGGITYTDMCDSVAVLTIEDTVDIDACLEGTVERYFIITDKCGNADTARQLITIVNDFVFDSAAIVWPQDTCIETCPADSLPETIGSMVIVPGDSCGVVSVSYTDVDVSDPDDVCLIIERTWSVSTMCTDTFMMDSLQVITIKNYRAPILSGPPLDTTINTDPDSCGATVTLPELVATDCSTGLMVTNNCTNGGAIVSGFFPVGEKTIIYTATDACGNVSTYQTILRIVDLTDPEITCPGDTTVDCGTPTDTATLGSPVAMDNCGAMSVEVTFVDTIVSGGCPSEFTIERTWTVEDSSGNTASCRQIINVQDTTGPIIVCPSDTLVDCDAAMDTSALGVATATDFCLAAVTDITFNDSRTDGSCPAEYTIERTWTAVDSCGNSSTCLQTIMVQDTVAPEISCPADVTVQCTEDSGPNNTGFATGLDNCDAAVTNIVFRDSSVRGMGQTLRIIFRTWIVADSCGNVDSCLQVVRIMDTQAPMITCPPDTTIGCDEPIGDLNRFGGPIFSDNCSGEMIMRDTIYDLNICNVGTITRIFIVSDSVGNTAECEQIITIELTDSLEADEIIWPDSVVMVDACVGIDPDSLDVGRPMVDSADATCFKLSEMYIDSIDYTCGAGVCSTVTRKWTLIDSCTLDTMTGDGIFMFTQIIQVIDTVPPVILCVQSDTFYISPDSMTCDVFVPLVAKAEDCSGIKYIRNNSQFGRDTFDDASGRYPKGGHLVTFRAEDSCCNLTVLPLTIIVLDTVPPQVTCRDVQKRISGEGPNAEATVCISEVVAMVFDNCDGPLDITASFDSLDISDTCRTYNCDSLMGNNMLMRSLPVYVRDNSGNLTVCIVKITITDQDGICAGMVVGGVVHNLHGEGLENAEMTMVNTPMRSMTDDVGWFSFGQMEVGATYKIQGGKIDEAINGVSLRDLIFIQRHLLGIDEFDSPYQYLAADANGSNSLEVRDLVLLRRLILGLDDDLPNVPDWYVVNADHIFRDITKPLNDVTAFSYFIPQLSQSMDLKFVGVKPGDVDGDAKINAHGALEERERGIVNMYSRTEAHISGLENRVTLHFDSEEIVQGLQLNFEYDPSAMQISSIRGEGIDILPGQYLINNKLGILRIIWSDILDPGPLNNVSISLSVEIGGAGDIEEELLVLDMGRNNSVISVSDAEYVINYNKKGKETPSTDVFILEQNIPNPFEFSTTIEFYLPMEDQVYFKIMDAQGREVVSRMVSSVPGWNTLDINNDDIGDAGIYYYQVSTSLGVQTKKMILID